DVFAVREVAVEQALAALEQELHGQVHAAQAPALDRQLARLGGAAAEDDGVELGAQLLRRVRLADPGPGHAVDALLRHQLHATLHDRLLQLQGRDAVHEQPADAVVALEHGDGVPGTVELRGARQARRTRTHHGNVLARAARRWLGDDPALFEAAV